MAPGERVKVANYRIRGNTRPISVGASNGATYLRPSRADADSGSADGGDRGDGGSDDIDDVLSCYEARQKERARAEPLKKRH